MNGFNVWPLAWEQKKIVRLLLGNDNIWMHRAELRKAKA